MSWVTISQRKMVLKNRINNLESELMRISQQLQTVANNESYNQQADQLNYNYELAAMNAAYMDSINSVDTNVNGDVQQQLARQKDIINITQKYNIAKQQQESIFQAKNNTRQSLTDAQANALEAQQEQIEAQLKAARAEYDSLGQAMDQDIKNGAIKLV